MNTSNTSLKVPSVERSLGDAEFFQMAQNGPRGDSSSTMIKRGSDASARMSARNSKHLAARMLRDNQMTLGGAGVGFFGDFG